MLYTLDVADAQKHVQWHRGDPRIRRADQIVIRPIGWGEGPYGSGRYGGIEQVVLDIASGTVAYVEDVVDKSLAFLEREMALLGA